MVRQRMIVERVRYIFRLRVFPEMLLTVCAISGVHDRLASAVDSAFVPIRRTAKEIMHSMQAQHIKPLVSAPLHRRVIITIKMLM